MIYCTERNKIMENKLYLFADHTAEGLSPALTSEDGWDVMFLNPLERLLVGNVKDMHKHTETRECFALVKGKAVLYTADGGDAPENIDARELQIGTICVVPKNVWHATAMTEDAKILLIENSNTTTENTFRCPLTEAQIAKVTEMAKVIL